MSNSALHQELVELLALTHAPVAVTFRDHASMAPAFDRPMSPPTDDGRSGRVPASCGFWAHAHEATFTTAPADHGNCSVGRFTHGLAQAADILEKSDVGALLQVGWVSMEAFRGVAALERKPESIEYGPLEQAEHTPDVVLLRVSPKQMMALGDAVPFEVSGKPQCQILPRAAAGAIAVSMGCALSRERTGMSDHELTCALPGDRVMEVVEGLRAVRRADMAVVGYAVADLQRFVCRA